MRISETFYSIQGEGIQTLHVKKILPFINNHRVKVNLPELDPLQTSLGFQYAHSKRTGMHPVDLEPYRVVYFGGFWYLIGNEPCTGILKRYALDRIRNLRLSSAVFKGVPDDLDTILQGSANIWFTGERNLEVIILVDSQISHYFKRRKMFPTQEIKEEKADGSLVVSYRIGHYEAVRNILKSWIPNIVILEPEEFKRDFLADVKGWVKRQSSYKTVTNTRSMK
jgi:predicted DNA-binding transcriptional regulator YafY